MSNSLYQLHAKAIEDFHKNGDVDQFFWTLKFECLASALEDLRMPDVETDAALWRRNPCPDELYFSHGEYIGDGLKHLIDELKEKPSSNRALYSLMAGKQISDSGDSPIPSFMLFQCSIEGASLKCACYFRAIELSKFLRVNLEEIRQILVEVTQEILEVKKVEIALFAFRAYVDVSASMLKKPQIELFKDEQLHKLLMPVAKNPREELARLLQQLHDSVTVVSSVKLHSLLRIISDAGPTAYLHEEIAARRPLLVKQLKVTIEKADALAYARTRSSHGQNVDKSVQDYRAAVSDLCGVLRK